MSASGRSLRTPGELAEAGLVAPSDLPALEAVAARYAVALTPAVAGLIDTADPHDPIARQFVPDTRELSARAGERADPIGDGVHSPVKGIVHRYPDRVLLKLTGVCPVYCRFCFRREMVGPDNGEELVAGDLARAMAYIADTSSIWEVIVSGGDPLILSPRRLREAGAALAEIAHVRVVRWHTRVPVVAPDLVSAALVEALACSGKATFVALHTNHASELTPEARAAAGRIVDAGIPMVSQTVLLAGVNDTPEALEALLRALVETRIKPYYLHHGDLAPGTAHHRTSIARGRALMAGLRGRLSGLAQPAYVLDIPGGHGKVPIGPGYLSTRPGGGYQVVDPGGTVHDYCDCGPQENEPPGA